MYNIYVEEKRKKAEEEVKSVIKGDSKVRK